MVPEKKRVKVKLIDKKAVETIFRIVFRYSSLLRRFSGAMIYKEDGTLEIPLRRSVSKINDNVPEFSKLFDQNITNRNE